jgi:outer membrane protein assembly factor BamB
MPSFRPALPLVLLVLGAYAAGAQEPPGPAVLPTETKQYQSRLKLAHELAAQKKWAEAVDEYQRLLRDAGDALVPAEADREDLRAAPRSVQLRRLCHLGLASLPPHSLEVYRRRVDLQARRWLKQGLAERDPSVLRRIVDEAFCSRPGDEALDALGDLAFERGDFAQAIQWWRLLAVPASEARAQKRPLAGTLLFPDPKVDVAGVRAKQVLALIFRDNRAAAASELRAFQKLYPKAEGHLAGRDGSYAVILKEWLGRPPDFPERESWPTFAGSAARGRALAAAPPRRLWAEGPTWRVRLDNPDKPAAPDEANVTVSADMARRLAFHPVICEGRVLLADARQVLAFDLWSGRLLFRYDLAQDGGRQDVPEQKLPADPGACYTLTAADRRVYACLGPATPAAAATKGARKAAGNCLVCLDLAADGKVKRRQRWLVPASAKAGEAVFFEGAPVVREGRVYVAVSRPAGARARTAVACYDADRGALHWEREVCDVPAPAGRHHLLTLAGGLVVYCCHAGAVVALDAETGKLAWGVRYPSRGSPPADGDPPPRDLAPPVYADGRLFVAPSDSDRLFCLDPYTGRMLWERDDIEVVHLLGCTHGRLVFTTPGGIRAVGARTGSDADGWLQPAEGRLPGFGRGLLAGGLAFWPVRDAKLPLRVLNVEDGRQWKGEDYFEPTQLRRIRPGNMASGQGCLVVAGVEELVGYVAPEKFLDQRRKDAARPGAGAKALYRLALAEVGAGLDGGAVRHLREAERAPGAGDVRGAARADRWRLLIDLAGRAQKSDTAKRRGELAAAYLGEAAAADFPLPLRLRALQALGRLWQEAGRPRNAIKVWQALLRDDALRRGTGYEPAGAPHMIGAWAAFLISMLVRDHGPDLYADIEQESAAALAGKDLAAALAHSAARYPNARATRSALRRLAGQPADPSKCPDLAEAYRSFLALGPEDLKAKAEADLAWRGLAAAYEGQQCWEAARAVWRRLADHDGDKAAARRLEAPEYVALAAEERRPATGAELRLPLGRAWQAPSGRLLVPCRSPLAPRRVEVCFAADGKELACLDAAAGRPRWKTRLSFAPTWVGCHADMVVAAWRRGIQAVRLADGRRLWTWPLDGDTEGAGEFSGFCLTSQHLGFLLDGQTFVALRLDAGAVGWDYSAPSSDLYPEGGGRLGTRFAANDRWVVLQTTGGHRCLRRSPDGVAWEKDAATAKEPWPSPPLPIDEHLFCLVEGRRRVVLLNADSGKELWTWKPRLPTTLTGEPPRLFGRRDALLLLVPRNIGYGLERLDPKTGAHLWPEGLRLLDQPVDAGAVATDRNAVYLAAGNTLLARSLSDGKLLWKCQLEESAPRWRVARAGNALLVWPQQREWLRWSWLPAGEFAVAAPLRARLGWPFPVLLYDPTDGKLRQRLTFETTVPEGTVQIFAGRLVVGVPGMAWGLQGPVNP